MNVLKNHNGIKSVEVLRPRDGDLIAITLEGGYSDTEYNRIADEMKKFFNKRFPNCQTICIIGAEKINIIRKE